MYAVLSFIEVLNIEFEEVAHDVVEHEEAGSLLDVSFVSVI